MCDATIYHDYYSLEIVSKPKKCRIKVFVYFFCVRNSAFNANSRSINSDCIQFGGNNGENFTIKEYRLICLYLCVVFAIARVEISLFHHSHLSSRIRPYFTNITSRSIILLKIRYMRRYGRRSTSVACNMYNRNADSRCQPENSSTVNSYRFVVKSTGLRLTRYVQQ